MCRGCGFLAHPSKGWPGASQDAVDSRKRDTMMVGLNKSRSEVGSLQDSLAAVQLALERREFDLEAKTSAPLNP